MWVYVSVSALVAVALGLGGLYLDRRGTDFSRTAIRVAVKVIANHGDDETVAPEFEITNGAYKGRRWTGSLRTSPAVHNVGDVGPGLFDPSSGEIQSTKYNRNNRLLGLALQGFSIGLWVGLAYFMFRARSIV